MKSRAYRAIHRFLTRCNRSGRQMGRWLLSISIILFCLAALSGGFGIISPLTRQTAAAEQQASGEQQGISRTAIEQIQSLILEKQSRTPEQRKIDSQLLYSMKMQRGERITAATPRLEVSAEPDSQGKIVVDITAEIGGLLLENLEEAGAEIIDVVPAYNSIRAAVPLDQLERIAGFPAVQFIQPKQEAMTHRINATERLGEFLAADRRPAPSFANRAQRVRAFLSEALPRLEKSRRASAPLAPPIAEGDTTHKAVNARSTFGINGTNIKIGVLSDGVINLGLSQAQGALGPVTVLPGQTGTGDEGTAMLEIVHALAPGAQLFFAAGLNGITRFAQNIRNLRAAGCEIIVDDLFYFVESPFHDGQAPGIASIRNGGVVTQAVNDVTAAGALYFSSAGNEGNVKYGTAGVWEGDFKDGGAAFGPLAGAGQVHDFGSFRLFNTLTGTASFAVVLHWTDPLGASANDYDLYILNSTGTSVLAAATNTQEGRQDPIEIVGAQAAGRRVVIVKYSGENRFLHLNTLRGRLTAATTGQTHGHSAAADAFSVAATPALGPFPNPFGPANRIETFSSDGPRRLFFRPDGTPITPGNFSATGGLLRQKPDITAADGVPVTGVGGFPTRFFGTSASAPHAAAIAALLKSANPTFTNAQIRTALLSTAIDIEDAGVDRNSGAGIVMAFESAQSLGVGPMADLELGAVAATEAGGNLNGFIESGESGTLRIELKNLGIVDATNVTATLTSSTPGVAVSLPNTSSYPGLAARTGAGSNAVPFNFRLSSIAPCNVTAFFTLTVNYIGGPSAKVFTFGLETGLPIIKIATALDATAPASGPNFAAATGLQTARITRDGLPSACGLNKAFPGVFAIGARRFDAYAFATCPGSAPACITVSLTNACTTGAAQVFPVVYRGSFDPNNVGVNYLADMGISPTGGQPGSFTFLVPGGSSFVIVVHEVNPGAATGCNYTLTVSGLCQSCAASSMVCLQDDRTGDNLLFNAATGDYLYTRCTDNVRMSGRGTVRREGCKVELLDGFRVEAIFNRCAIAPQNKGEARIQLNPVGATCFINDSNTANNRCLCP